VPLQACEEQIVVPKVNKIKQLLSIEAAKIKKKRQCLSRHLKIQSYSATTLKQNPQIQSKIVRHTNSSSWSSMTSGSMALMAAR
jgi:hypothetical protein